MAHPVDDNPSRVIAYLIKTNGSNIMDTLFYDGGPSPVHLYGGLRRHTITYVHCFAYVLTPVFLQNISS
jgi:hypothetical protein